MPHMTDMVLRCQKESCQHVWLMTFELPMDIRVFTQRLFTESCPQCGHEHADILDGKLADGARKLIEERLEPA